MQRILTTTDLGDNRIRHRIRIESDDCDPSSTLIEPVKQMLMQNFANDPSLLHCGTVPFQILKMFHNGKQWIIEAEAIVESTYAKELRNQPST